MRRGTQGLIGAALCGLMLAPLLAGGPAGAADPPSIKIGVVSSLFRDTPKSLIHLLSQPLKALMESQTGMTGDLHLVSDAHNLSQKLKNEEVELGVFHGFEYAWAKQKNPDLRPLVLVVAKHRDLHAHLVVRKDSPAKTCGDLKGQVLAIPHMSREHCHLYVQRRCPGAGVDPKKFFSEIVAPSSTDDALADVVDGVAGAAVVDRVALEQYQKTKPARADKLRVLHQSETFPAGVIAYQDGKLSPSVLKRFREGLLTADQSARGRELLKLTRITNFVAVHPQFEQQLEAIARAYPPSVSK